MFVSTKAVEAALLSGAPTPEATLLLVILSSMVDGRLQCFPSMGTLRARSRIKSEATVRKHLKVLVEAGLLRIEADHVNTGRRTSNVYTVLLPVEGAKPAPEMDKPRRTHATTRRPVDKAVVNRRATPQNMRGHPSGFEGTYPAKSAGLEPQESNQRRARESEAPVVVDNPTKGRRYALPHPPVIRPVGGRLSDEDAAAGLRELADRLRSSGKAGLR